ncbi:MAG: methyltransferase domain-containing protein [Bacteroidales bacterium]|nr:methyltransferase domain-containing protein [Bacteroidales bacterium]HOI31162.1 methyltransferase domain-containing protein [Bacteroidales bacterium]
MQLKSLLPLNLGIFLRNNYLFLKGLAYRGDQFYCPFCNSGFKDFLDGGTAVEINEKLKVIGSGLRPKTICPGCHSNDRERLLHWLFENRYPVSSTDKILHIAPEPSLGRYLKAKSPNGYISGVKYYEGFYYPPGVKLMDLLELPFKTAYFDWVICNHVLEHIPNDYAAMKAIHEVLKIGGKAILQVPWSPLLETTKEDSGILEPHEREAAFGQFDHVRIYGHDYPLRLKKAGFKVETLQFGELQIPQNEVAKMRLNQKECIFIVTK